MHLRPILVVGAVIALTLVTPLAAQAAQPASAHVYLGLSCMDGTGPAGAEVLVTLRTPDGALRDRFKAHAGPRGFWSGCFEQITELRAAVNAGDRVRIVIGSRVLKATVPPVTPLIDRARDIIHGRAPAGARVLLGVDHFEDFGWSAWAYEFETMADESGRYAYDSTNTVDLIGLDSAGASVKVNGITFTGGRRVPNINVRYATNVVTGSANPGELRIVIRDAQGALKHVDLHRYVNGDFFLTLDKEDGTAAYPVDGDTVSANLAGDAHLLMPKSLLTGDPATDVVRGRCMPNAPYELWVRHNVFHGVTDVNGRLQRDVGRTMNLRTGNRLMLRCLYPTGDIWERSSIAL